MRQSLVDRNCVVFSNIVRLLLTVCDMPLFCCELQNLSYTLFLTSIKTALFFVFAFETVGMTFCLKRNLDFLMIMTTALLASTQGMTNELINSSVLNLELRIR